MKKILLGFTLLCSFLGAEVIKIEPVYYYESDPFISIQPKIFDIFNYIFSEEEENKLGYDVYVRHKDFDFNAFCKSNYLANNTTCEQSSKDEKLKFVTYKDVVFSLKINSDDYLNATFGADKNITIKNAKPEKLSRVMLESYPARISLLVGKSFLPNFQEAIELAKYLAKKGQKEKELEIYEDVVYAGGGIFSLRRTIYCIRDLNDHLLKYFTVYYKSKEIKLSDILDKNSPKLLALIKDKLKHLPWAFVPIRLSLNDNFYLDQEGVVFVFNKYQVSSGVAGMVEIRISYENIKKYADIDVLANLKKFNTVFI